MSRRMQIFELRRGDGGCSRGRSTVAMYHVSPVLPLRSETVHRTLS